VSPVKYELGFYIPEDGILHSHRRENLKSDDIRHVLVPSPGLEPAVAVSYAPSHYVQREDNFCSFVL
jgi:hypothetical protein